jgi:hypothetical protein
LKGNWFKLQVPVVSPITFHFHFIWKRAGMPHDKGLIALHCLSNYWEITACTLNIFQTKMITWACSPTIVVYIICFVCANIIWWLNKVETLNQNSQSNKVNFFSLIMCAFYMLRILHFTFNTKYSNFDFIKFLNDYNACIMYYDCKV